MGIRKHRPYVPILAGCCGVAPRWVGEGTEKRVQCPKCGRVSAPNVIRGAAARDWNFFAKRGKVCAKGHPDPEWIREGGTGKRRCRECREASHLAYVPPDPNVTAVTLARVGWALDAALRASKVTIGDAIILSGVRNIGGIRNGEDNPTVETLARIADSIGMDLWVTFVGRRKATVEALTPTTTPTGIGPGDTSDERMGF